MALKVRLGMVDHSAENTSMQFYTGGDVADDYSANISAAQLMQTGIAVLTLLNFGRLQGSFVIESDVPTLPADDNAQREQALQITYADTVNGKKYHLNIPGIDRTLVAQSGTDVVDLANAVVATFVALMQAQMVSELGNAIEVVSARLIGRAN